MSEGADRPSDLRAELEAARRELAETAEALAAHAGPPDAAPATETSSVEIVPAAPRTTKAPVLYRPVPSPRRRAAFGLALGVAALLLRRLTR